MLWQKIKGNMRSIAWHPVKENLIAYETVEGIKNHALYSCGESDLICYDADKPNKDSTLILGKR
ncbi:gem-associated protein 5-like [Vespula squamosa]|uniref:Gem-associated protein 5-like n=1 Tax=Vespula squamosa TaxID=30214 RepID=A0ABD2C1Z7_VESSQ